MEVAMPQKVVSYTAYMPVDGSQKIIHLQCDDPSRTYEFIEMKVCGTSGVIYNSKNPDPDNVLRLGVPTTDEKTVKEHLGMYNHHEDVEVEIVVVSPTAGRTRSNDRYVRRMQRANSGPPRGWQPR